MTEADIDAVMAIAARLRDAPHWTRSGYEVALEAGVWPQRLALVAETDGLPVAGFLVAVLIPPEAELESIAVAPEFQRRGSARALFGQLACEVMARKCSEILLEVRPSNGAGRAFYEALGFVETGRRPDYYTDPVEDAILMRLGFGPRQS